MLFIYIFILLQTNKKLWYDNNVLFAKNLNKVGDLGAKERVTKKKQRKMTDKSNLTQVKTGTTWHKLGQKKRILQI